MDEKWSKTFSFLWQVHPNPNRPAHLRLKMYEFAGRLVGKCLYESSLGGAYKQLVRARFTRSFLAQIIGLRMHYKVTWWVCNFTKDRLAWDCSTWADFLTSFFPFYLFIFKDLFVLCVCVFCLLICTYTRYIQCPLSRKHGVSWNWSYRWLWASIWVLFPEPLEE
jgi:hypothetical protein